MSDELTPEQVFGDDPKAKEPEAEAEVTAEQVFSDVPTTEAPAEEAIVTPEQVFGADEPEPVVVEPVPVKEAPADAKAGEESEDEEEEAEKPQLIKPAPDDGVRRRWYAIHAHSGQEGNVQKSLIGKAEQTGLDAMITNVLVPMEEVAEFKSGEKKFSQRKYFPGYVLVQLPEHPEKHADLWHLIKETPGVTGFIGSRHEPVPLEDEEVQSLVEEIRGERERPKTKVNFDIGERVKIIDGAFSNFLGNIGEISEERGKMKVMIEIFERQTSVEVEFWQVEKL